VNREAGSQLVVSETPAGPLPPDLAGPWLRAGLLRGGIRGSLGWLLGRFLAGWRFPLTAADGQPAAKALDQIRGIDLRDTGIGAAYDTLLLAGPGKPRIPCRGVPFQGLVQVRGLVSKVFCWWGAAEGAGSTGQGGSDALITQKDCGVAF